MWSTRPATAHDRKELVALCRASVGPDDYVPLVLDDFLATGVVLTAEDHGRPIGMVVYHDVFDGSAWLHAARTHPDYRRQGVATELMRHCERVARRRGRSVMRLWASADNVASVRANTKYGYRERARFTRMRLDTEGRDEAVPLEPVGLAREWPRMRDSAVLRAGGGYLFHDFYFVPLTRPNASWLSRHKALWRFGDNVVSLSDDFELPGRRSLQVQLVAGDAGAMLAAAAGVARSRGVRRVESFLPHDRGLLTTATKAGFRLMDWGQEAVLFEKGLPASRAGSGRGPRRHAGRGAE